MSIGLTAQNSDKLSRIYLEAASLADLPAEARCLLAAAAIEKAIEAVFLCNKLLPPNRDQALFLFHEKYVLNGGFSRGIEKAIAELYRMRDGIDPMVEDGGNELARKVHREIHSTVKAWLKEQEWH